MPRSIAPTTFNSQEDDFEINDLINGGRRYNYIKTPIELIACPFFSRVEKDIITEIIGISNKILTKGTKGACWYSNSQLAMRHRVSEKVITATLTKANRLGFITEREDIIDKYTKKGVNTFSTRRRICMSIPEEWIIMGDLYNEAFVQMDPEFIQIFEEIENKLQSISTKNIDREEIISIIEEGTSYLKSQKNSTPPTKKIAPPLLKNYPANKRDNNKRDIEVSKDTSLSSSKNSSKNISGNKNKISPDEIMSLWNKIAINSNLPTVLKITPARREKIKSRQQNADLLTLSDWRLLFRKISKSPFLCGENNRGWKANFDWIIKNDSNYVKILEGDYSPNDKKPSFGKKNNDVKSHSFGDYAKVKKRTIVNQED